MSQQNNAKQAVQTFGRALTAMIMPNIGAFIAWGLITALFIPTGWLPNENLSGMVGPMITYLLPLLIAYTAGHNVYGVRGGVIGTVVTMGVICGTDIPMFLGAMIFAPLAAVCMKWFDNAIKDSVPAGFEMLVNNFSLGILGTILAILGFLVVGPVVAGASAALGNAVRGIVNMGLLPMVSIFVEPAKILFLNNAINHGVFTPLGMEEANAIGKSVFFLLETNPGPGLGILLAYWMFAKGSIKESAPGAVIIHFFGGIHEIYFPYVLMNPLLLLAVIGGGMAGVLTFTIFGAGLVASPSPGSIVALMLMTPKGGHLGVLAGVTVATVVSFLIASIFVKRAAGRMTDADLEASQGDMKAMKAESKGAAVSGGAIPTVVELIVYACDAGMGSSAMGASMLGKRLKKAGYNVPVKNFAINDIPKNASVVVTHESLTARAKTNAPNAYHISVTDFLDMSVAEKVTGMLGGSANSSGGADVKEEVLSSKAFAKENIMSGLKTVDKKEAIIAAGEHLVKLGYVDKGYVDAMLKREEDVSTYLGKGVAIPHGVNEAKKFVKSTGIVVHRYPQGAMFDGNPAYLVIGIAAVGDEHLGVISRLAEILDEGEIERIQEIAASNDIEFVYNTFK